jgi:hypothetical protein
MVVFDSPLGERWQIRLGVYRGSDGGRIIGQRKELAQMHILHLDSFMEPQR